MPDLEPGTIFAGHRIEGVAGRGGMGVVYRATHLALDYVVALKVISPELASDERFRERFVRESRAAVSIRHPNVVQVRHAGEEDDLLFVTMDLIDGVDLGRLIRDEGALEPGRAVAIVAQVGAALDAAHDKGLLHRDVKPGNVLIEERAGGEHAYLTDFGLTKRIASNTGVTATGAFVGTIDYVAPEQIKGGTLDARTDEYALGCVLFETIAGDPPFADRGEQVAKLYAHLQDTPPPLSEAGPPGTPAALDAVVARALEKEPDRRFQSAGALAEAAGTVLTVPEATMESAAPPPSAEPIAPPPPAPSEEAPAAPAKSEEAPAPSAEPAEPKEGLTPFKEGDESAGHEPEGGEPKEGLTPGGVTPGVEGEEAGADDRRAPDLSTRAMPPPKKPSAALVWLRRGVAAALLIGIVAGIYALASGGSSGGSDTTADKGGGSNGTNPAPAKGRVFGTPIPVKGMPIGIGVGPGGVWTSLRDKGAVVNIDPRTGDVSRPIGVGSMPNGLADKLGRIWVTNAGDGTVTPITIKTMKAGKAIKVGTDPRAIGFADGSLWVANTGSGTVSRIEGDGSVSHTITVESGPRGVAADDSGVWISNGDSDSVSVIDPKSNLVSHTIQLAPGSNPKGSAISGGRAWIANEGDGTVTPINTKTFAVEPSIPVGKEPRDVAVAGGDLFVSDGGSGTVTRITPAGASPTGKPLTVPLHLSKGSSPENASSGFGEIWVADGGTDTVVPLTPISKKK